MHEIVLYKKRNFSSVGLLIESDGKSVTILNEEGKTIKIDPDHIIYNSNINSEYYPNIDETKLELRSYRKQLEEERHTINLKTIWECCYDSDNNVVISLEDIISLHPDFKNDKNKLLKLVWSIERDDIYFKKDNDHYVPKNIDEINKTIKIKNEEQIIIKERNSARDWIRLVQTGDIDTTQEDISNHSKYVDLIREYAIKGDESDRAREAKTFITESGLKDEHGALEFLIRIGLWKEDEDPVFAKYGIKNTYPSKIINESHKLLDKDISYDKLVDISKLKIYSIDDENTTDIDDALSIEIIGNKCRIGIHITNVASLIEPDSLLDKDALKRGETIYLPEGSIHMFPSELVSNLLSLKEGTIRKAISLFATFDKDNNLVHHEFLQTKIRINKNINYDDAIVLIQESDKWKRLFDITATLKESRINNGAIILQLPTLKISVEKSNVVNIVKNYMNTPAHNMIAELMILINRLSASYINSRNIPALYRTQTELISEEIHTLDEDNILFPIEVIKFLKPTRISHIPGVHRFLGVSEYLQISSPIRRYLDLVMQRQLLRSLEGKRPLYTNSELESINTKIDMAVKEKKLIEKTRERYWILKYLDINKINTLYGTISSVRNKRASAYFPDYLMEIPFSITSDNQMILGNKIEFVIESIDLIRKKINIKPA